MAMQMRYRGLLAQSVQHRRVETPLAMMLTIAVNLKFAG
jgi:hypothetical protein